MKNLLILTSRYPHKNDSLQCLFVYLQVEELRKHFEKVVVISSTPYTPSFFTRWMQPKRKMDSLAKDYDYDNVSVHFLKNIYFPFEIGYRYRGKQCFKAADKYMTENNLNFDLIHAHFSWPSGYIATRLKSKYKVPTILTVHENREWFIEESKQNYIREVWKKVDGVIRVNKIDLDILENYNTNVTSIPNGYSPKLYDDFSKSLARSKLGIQKHEKVIFSLGHLIKRKGFLDLIDAVKLLNQQRNDFKLYIGGDGPMRSTLQKVITKNNLDNVKLLGYVSSEDLPLWMNAIDIFALTSYSEGNPTVMFEALGCGKPVVSTKVGGVPEILINEDYGFLVENDSVDISSKLDSAINKRWDEDKIKRYASSFTWENIVADTLSFYKTTLKNS